VRYFGRFCHIILSSIAAPKFHSQIPYLNPNTNPVDLLWQGWSGASVGVRYFCHIWRRTIFTDAHLTGLSVPMGARRGAEVCSKSLILSSITVPEVRSQTPHLPNPTTNPAGLPLQGESTQLLSYLAEYYPHGK